MSISIVTDTENWILSIYTLTHLHTACPLRVKRSRATACSPSRGRNGWPSWSVPTICPLGFPCPRRYRRARSSCRPRSSRVPSRRPARRPRHLRLRRGTRPSRSSGQAPRRSTPRPCSRRSRRFPWRRTRKRRIRRACAGSGREARRVASSEYGAEILRPSGSAGGPPAYPKAVDGTG